MAKLRIALWPLALLAGFGALGITLTSNHDDQAAAKAVLTLLLGWSFALSGLVAWARRPANAFGPLMVAAGFAWFASALDGANHSLPFTIGLLLQNLPFAFIVHALLVFPRGRLDWWVTRTIAVAAYVDALALQFLALLFSQPSANGDCTGCPDNALLVGRHESFADAVNGVAQVGGIVLTVALGLIYAYRHRTATPAARRIIGPVLVAGLAAAVLLAVSLSLSLAGTGILSDVFLVLAAIALASVPLASLAGLLQSRLARFGVGNLLVELGQRSLAAGELQDAIARALNDPSVSIAYWLPEAHAFVDDEGRPIAPPSPENERWATMVERSGERIAAILHDVSLRDETELVQAVVAAAGLALDNERRLVALGRSESRNRALLDAIPDMMFRVDRNGTYLAYKAESESELGAPPAELVGKTVRDYLPRDVAGPMMRCVEETIASQRARTMEYELDLEGLRRHFEARIVPADPDEVVMIVRDFTERHEVEAELQRLQAELERRLEELQASRARIVEATDLERRRLERNLHDGAQQRLVSVSLSVRLAQSRLGNDLEGAADLLAAASDELANALEELRELARGIHPAVLTDRGLGPALESLVTRTPLPVELDAPLDERLPEPVEAAAYYVVAEALANIAKYADATQAAVRVSRLNGLAVVEVEDDGVGGADPSHGSGLRGLADRVEALHGRLAVESEPGQGTRIRAEIPCG